MISTRTKCENPYPALTIGFKAHLQQLNSNFLFKEANRVAILFLKNPEASIPSDSINLKIWTVGDFVSEPYWFQLAIQKQKI